MNAGGVRRPTMGDIAAHLGLSRQLVSAVLRDAPGASQLNRERVREAARVLGYSPHVAAQTLRRSRSRQIGVVFILEHPFDLDMVDGLYRGARRRQYGVVLSAATAGHSEYQAARELIGFRTEGVVLLGPNLPDDDLRTLLHGDPLVMFGRKHRLPGIDAVRSDDARGISDVVAHLVDLGHRDIVHIDGANLPGGRERRTSFSRAMKSRGLDAGDVIGGDYTEESGAAAAGLLLQRSEIPTAVVAANDRCAVGVMEVLIRAGLRVPQDISVTGFDDSRLSRLSYRRLTTVRQDADQLSEAILDTVIDRIEGRRGLEPARDTEIVVPTALVVRDTSGPVRRRSASLTLPAR